mgnify:CR=1 FL=1
MSLISAHNLTKVFPDGTEALRGVSVSMSEGEMVAIMGPSGSGKSTLLHILGFLDRQSDGVYEFQGKTFAEHSEEEIAHVRNRDLGFVFQMFNLLPRVSVLENVMVPLYYSEVPEREWEERSRTVLETVGLSHRLAHDPAELSGGERQRVAIARALVTNPRVIFADEPTGNLNTEAGAVVMKMLQQLHDAGKTVVVITHEPAIAEYCKRLVYIKDGLIEEDRPLSGVGSATRSSSVTV